MTTTSESNIESMSTNTASNSAEAGREMTIKNLEVTAEFTLLKALESLIIKGGILAALLVVCFTIYPFWYVWVAACIQALYVIGIFLGGVLTLFGTITVTFKAGKKMSSLDSLISSLQTADGGMAMSVSKSDYSDYTIKEDK